jgi:acyl transferase domain-containing protein
VSNSSLRGVTICGPPVYLYRLRKSKELCDTNAIPLPIYAPYHAPHLYSSQDIESLLDIALTSQRSLPHGNLPVVSSGFEGIFQAEDLRHGLYNALSDMFLRPMEWQSMTGAVLSTIKPSKNFRATVIPLPSAAASSLCGALASSRGIDVEIESSLFQTSHDQPSYADYSGLASATTQNKSRSKIAIVGMSGRFPSANNATEFWNILYKGLDVHKIVPATRWSAETHVDTLEKRKNTSATPYGCWLDEAGLFDARFFGISPREAVQMDPAQRIALMTAYEALEQGGIVPDNTPSTRRDRVGVSYGVTSNDWMETNSAQDIDTYFIPGGNRAFIPGRINYYFKFSGPSYAIDTACSSSLAAIHVACNVLWRSEADTMIAGGTNILTNPDFTAGLDRGHFLSRTGNCKTFDDRADGYCRGEGVGTVILKRLEDALADNDPIQGVILNICTNHSAESESITRPYLGAQRAIFDSALDGLDPVNVSYIEMHGTGTQVGDAIEMSSVLEVFAPSSGPQRRLQSHPLYIGSVKANVGHGGAAAGVTGLAKLLLMMQHNTIPPHCGIRSRINHRFPTDLSARGVHIAKKPVKWVNPLNGTRRALLNNFSAAGGNTTLLLEDAPLRDLHHGSDSRSTHVIVMSAKVFPSLKANATSLLSLIQSNHTVPLSLSSISYTSTARRVHHPHRIAVSGSSLEEIATSLSHAIEFETGKTRASSRPEVVFAFSGQGSHYLGMGKELYDNIPSFRADISRYDQIARNQGFSPFLQIIAGNEIDLATCSPMATQLATTSLQMALVRLWASWGIVPRSVIGHSIGFYASLNAAGVLSEADTIYLIGTRARQLQEKCRPETHMMLAVKAKVFTITIFLEGTGVEVACINGPDDTVLSGPREEIEAVYLRLASQGISGIRLNIPYAFHSSQVDCVLEDFKSAAHGAVFRRPSIPVICPLTANVVCKHGIFGANHLANHFRKCVNMIGALEAATRDGFITKSTTFIEIGHNSTVSVMLQATLNAQHKILPSLKKNEKPWKTLADVLSALYMAGADIDWKEYHRDFASWQQVISLPHYNWDLKDYWIKYVHDWSLRKGDPPLINANLGPSILCTTIHEVVSEEVEKMTGAVVFQSDISRSDLHSIVQGHKVNDIPLCTPVSIASQTALLHIAPTSSHCQTVHIRRHSPVHW